MTVGMMIAVVWCAAVALYLVWQFATDALGAAATLEAEPESAAGCRQFEVMRLQYGEVSGEGHSAGHGAHDATLERALRPSPPTAA